MGCISSKVMARSISFHEERKKGTLLRTRSNNGFPLLEDIIISANNSSDHYLALVLHSRSFSSNAASKLAIIDNDGPASSETIDKLEISSTRLVEDDLEGGKQIGTIDQRNKSKSCHLFLTEHDFPSLSQENSSGFEKHKDDLSSSKGAVRSRSFHTVEEYDDLVKKLRLSESLRFQESESNERDDDGSSGTNNMDLLLVSESALSSRRTAHDHIHTDDDDKDSAIKDSNSSGIIQDKITNEKGNKRKAIAKRLQSLRIPLSNNIECPAIASLREWIPPSGNIYSPGSYVTPKFGSYSSSSQMAASGRNAREDSSIFSPELVSAFEECMQKLEAEEENILKQIMENFGEESNGGKMKSQEMNP